MSSNFYMSPNSSVGRAFVANVIPENLIKIV